MFRPRPRPRARTVAVTGTSAAAAVALAAAIIGSGGSPAAAGSPQIQPNAIASVVAAPAGLDKVITVPVAATAVSSAAKTGQAGTGCRVLTRADHRMKRIIARGNSSAGTKGSIAYLRAKAAAETKAGHTKEAAAATARANRRTAALPKLTKTEHDLAALLAADCA